MYFPRNNILVASFAEGVRKLCRDPDLASAVRIEISNVRMAEIPEEIFAATRLKALWITESRLKAVSPRIGELAELEELNLADNALETLPPEVEGLASLESLDLSGNRFRDFPAAVARIRSLVRLNLSENRLASVDPCVCQLENLSDLELTDNPIAELPECLARMPRLADLGLLDTRIRDLPRPPGAYPALKFVAVEASQVSDECLAWLHDKPFWGAGDIFQEIVGLIPRLDRDPERAFPPPGVEEWEIRAFEAETGLQVPPDLRRWLGFINGAGLGLGGVFGIRTRNPHEDAGKMFKIYPNWMERGWIPVGGDGCGNYYVLATRPEDGPGTPVFFIEPIHDPDSPRYIVASGLFPFLRSYFRKDLGERGWPCDPDSVLANDPALTLYRRHPKCWDADDWAPP